MSSPLTDATAEEQFQTVAVNTQTDAKRKALMNAISTTKYTLITWLPKSIWEQFRRIANIYFLIVSILMLIGTYATYIFVSPLNPYSTIVTLVFVLLVTSIKEGVEDLRRSRSDKFGNERDVTVITFSPSTGEEITTVKKSKNINPGDIIKLTGQCAVPADMVLVLTSFHNDGNKCFIETANIDGETNLKVREASPTIAENFPEIIAQGIAKSEIFQGSIEMQKPNKNIHKFTGTMTLTAGKESIPLSADNILLRSALFSNTDWGYGIAIYTGQSTKIQMNNRLAPSKLSSLERSLNYAIILIFIAQFTLVTFSVGSIYMTKNQYESSFPYIYPPNDDGGVTSVLPLWLSQWFVFLLLYNNFIPISLYVTIELVNIGQAFLVASDELMYRAELDVPCAVRSSNLVQELGMVSNIFSDKTGTLTRNEMKFVKFMIHGQMYDVPYATVDVKEAADTAVAAAGTGTGMTPPATPSVNNGSATSGATTGTITGKEGEKKGDEEAAAATAPLPSVQELLQGFGNTSNQQAFMEFLRCLVTCHTVVREKSGNYRAESPDELALVEGMAGYRSGLLERSSKEMIVELLGERITYEVLAVNPFNSDRKRMSVLIRESTSKGQTQQAAAQAVQYYVMCKGADNIMLPLCALGAEEKAAIDRSLFDLANMGLRTLVVASKKVDTAFAQQWLQEYKAASVATVNREAIVAEVGGRLEVEMTCLGITAIEDRLQDEVPEVIADLAKAGIIVWMLTGDKLETAINIGHSCNLLLHDTRMIMLTNMKNADEFAQRLTAEYDKLTSGPMIANTALVIDGISFGFFNHEDADQRQKLLYIGQHCRSVIACRLTPTQKREIVMLVKVESTPRAITLSIGDGANDVSMILEADVGVGIYGKEGRQAANNADFAIGEFKFLRRLVLLHGRWNYIRQSSVFLYSMHKNMVITLTLFWYSYFSAISGTTIYESWIYTSFNFILGLPIIFFGMLDRDLSSKFILDHPQVYYLSRSNSLLAVGSIIGSVMNALIYAVVFCLLVYYAAKQTFMDWSLYAMGTAIFTSLCNALQMKVAFFHHHWAWPNWLVMFISLAGMLIYYLIIASAEYDYYYVSEHVYGTGFFWFFSFFTMPIFVIMIDWCYYWTRMMLYPSLSMLYKEAEISEYGLVDDDVLTAWVPWLKATHHSSVSVSAEDVTLNYNKNNNSNNDNVNTTAGSNHNSTFINNPSSPMASSRDGSRGGNRDASKSNLNSSEIDKENVAMSSINPTATNHHQQPHSRLYSAAPSASPAATAAAPTATTAGQDPEGR